MIFAKHNFTTNFINAIGYQDEFMADQIIIDEVARMIVDDKKNVVEALRKVGVNATYKDNNDFIKALLVKEIEDGNPDILKFLSEKILQNQADEEKLKELVHESPQNATGSVKTKSKFGENLSKIFKDENVKESLTNILSSGIKNVFSKKNTEKTSNDEQLTERLKVNEMKSATKKTSKKKILIIAGVTIGVVGLAVFVYYLVRRKYENGGVVPSAQLTSTPPSTGYPTATPKVE
jgi:predicted transcriptional regulator with HTH domain